MKIRYFIIIILVLTSLIFTQEKRGIRDNIGFSWDLNDFTKIINYLNNNSSVKIKDKNMKIFGGISPHDDYLYAGKVYFPLFKLIRTKEVVIFGVTHSTVRKNINDPKNIVILDNFKKWTGIRKDIEVSELRELVKNKLNKKYYIVSNKAHKLEHSIEALIPFLQYYNPDIKITPIMITKMKYEKMKEISKNISSIIFDYVKKNNLTPGKDIIFLISSDSNHYGMDFDNYQFGKGLQGYNKAKEYDKYLINNFLSNDLNIKKIQGFYNKVSIDNSKVLWCGKYSIPFGLTTIYYIAKSLKINLKMKILNYSDTFKNKVLCIKDIKCGITAPFSLEHWVSFVSILLYY